MHIKIVRIQRTVIKSLELTLQIPLEKLLELFGDDIMQINEKLNIS